ncbi:MAG: NAD-dependent protein deacetylase, family [Clostridiales bacterium]|nr:NAD-dependent protein deacetylase, family [Clostridiales bacterium]
MDAEEFTVREEDIPRCPKCGSYMSKNLRVDDTFVEAPRMEKQEGYIDFVNTSVGSKLLLIELGVGFNTPGIIRWPFEKIVRDHPNAKFIRMNAAYPEVPKEIEDRSVTISESIDTVTSLLKNYLISRGF